MLAMAGNIGLHKWKWIIIFLAPSLVGMVIFIVYPILSSFWLAFNDWNLLTPPPLRILHLTLGSDAGGLSTYVLNLSNALREQGHAFAIAGVRACATGSAMIASTAVCPVTGGDEGMDAG